MSCRSSDALARCEAKVWVRCCLFAVESCGSGMAAEGERPVGGRRKLSTARKMQRMQVALTALELGGERVALDS